MTGKAAVLLALTGMMAAAQAAEDKPLWELGAGVAAFSFPSYRGSDQSNNFLMPVPHFTYHGQFLKADRHGVRGSFFDSDRLDLTVSAALSPPPANSDDIAARTGMPDPRQPSRSVRRSTSPCGARPAAPASSSCCCPCAPPLPSRVRPRTSAGCSIPS